MLSASAKTLANTVVAQRNQEEFLEVDFALRQIRLLTCS